MRTLEDIERDLEIAEKGQEAIMDADDEAVKKYRILREEAREYKLQNGIFTPISELEKHKGKSISYIELVVRNEDGSLETEDMYGDEHFNINEKGHLNYSSYENGVMYYNSEIGKYEFDFHCIPIIYDFIGYLEVKFKSED